MGAIRPVARLAGAAASAVFLVGAAALPAFAADPSASPGTGSGGGAGILDAGQSFVGVIALLVFGLVALAFIFLYLFASERQFFDAVRGAARTGGEVEVTEISAIASAQSVAPSAVAADDLLAALPTPVSLKVSGPGQIRVGTFAQYHARNDAGDPVEEATWIVAPATMALVAPTTSSSVRVVAVKGGTFKLTASLASAPVSVTLTVHAVQPKPAAAAVKLPFIGGGWGSIVGGMTIAVLAGVLALARVLSGEAVATIYGSLAGYLLGAVHGASGSNTSGSGAAGGGASGGATGSGTGSTGSGTGSSGSTGSAGTGDG